MKTAMRIALEVIAGSYMLVLTIAVTGLFAYLFFDVIRHGIRELRARRKERSGR